MGVLMKHPYFVPDTVQEDKTEDVNDMVRFISGHELFNNKMYHDALYNVLTEYEKTKDIDTIIMSWLPFLKIKTPIPHEEMFDEAKRLLPFFVNHRGDAYNWKSLCLWGLSHAHTGVPEDYGMEETDELEEQYMDWTDMSKFCPATKNWLENDFGFNSFTRVRFMLIEPGGYIKPHSDTDHSELIAINIALNMPEKCYFIVDKYGCLPLNAGDIFLFNNSYTHAVWNQSNEPRIHMIVYGGRDWNWWEKKIVENLKNVTKL